VRGNLPETMLIPLPEPFGKIAQVIIAVIFIIVLLSFVFGFGGSLGFAGPRLH
jgi:hypothetical protein